jgi:hypothetical protein
MNGHGGRPVDDELARLQKAFCTKEKECKVLIEHQRQIDDEVHELTATVFIVNGSQ